MLKKWLLFLLILSVIPVHAGEVEKALDKGYNVFLYLYTPECKYCKKFAPIFKKLSILHNGEFVFVKSSIYTKYGVQLYREYSGHFVPYVLLISPRKKTAFQVPAYCLFDSKCMESAMAEARK